MPAGSIDRSPVEQILPAGALNGQQPSAQILEYLWLAHQGSRSMVRIDPENNFERTVYETNARVYSYSDFTGVVRRMAIGQGTPRSRRSATRQRGRPSIGLPVPPGGSVSFQIQTAAERRKLDEARLVSAGRTPGDEGPINVSGRLNLQQIASRRFLRVTASLTLGDGNRSPILQGFTVRWNCD